MILDMKNLIDQMKRENRKKDIMFLSISKTLADIKRLRFMPKGKKDLDAIIFLQEMRISLKVLRISVGDEACTLFHMRFFKHIRLPKEKADLANRVLQRLAVILYPDLILKAAFHEQL